MTHIYGENVRRLKSQVTPYKRDIRSEVLGRKNMKGENRTRVQFHTNMTALTV